MSDNVTSLHGAEIISDRRDRLTATVAQAFDEYVRANGEEPEAIAFVLGGALQGSQLGWHAEGDSDRGITSFLALAAQHLTAEVSSQHKPRD